MSTTRCGIKIRAVVLAEYGTEQSIQFITTRLKPVCGFQQVSIRVKACALSSLDAQVRSGHFRDILPPLPCVPGYTISGVVDTVGAQVSHVKSGDEVVAICPLNRPDGGLAEFTVQDAANVVVKPEALSHEEAAASLLPGLSAYIAVHYHGRVQPGQFVLLIANSHGNNTFIPQMCGHIGAKLIVAVTSNDAANLYSDCGGHVVRIVDLNTDSLVDCVMDETCGLGVNVVIDLLSGQGRVQPFPDHNEFVQAFASLASGLYNARPLSPSLSSSSSSSLSSSSLSSSSSSSFSNLGVSADNPSEDVVFNSLAESLLSSSSVVTVPSASFPLGTTVVLPQPADVSGEDDAQSDSGGGESNAERRVEGDDAEEAQGESESEAGGANLGDVVGLPGDGQPEKQPWNCVVARSNGVEDVGLDLDQLDRDMQLLSTAANRETSSASTLPSSSSDTISTSATAASSVFSSSGSSAALLVSVTDTLTCLAPHGTWVTSDPLLELSPAENRQLFLRGAGLAYLFPHAWILAPTQHGRLMHIIADLMHKLTIGVLLPPHTHRFGLDRVKQAHRDVFHMAVGVPVVSM